MIDKGLYSLKNYIEKNDYRGYDPYDALQSPFFKWPILKSSKWIRFGTQQLAKRLPFSIRPILLVPKGYNPVTLGLSIQAYTYFHQFDAENQAEHFEKIKHLVSELKTMIPEGFSGACWGYDFDWEARYSKIEAFEPSVVATGIIANALFLAFKETGYQECADLVTSAKEFVIKDLNRVYDGESFCFSYSPFDDEQVFNASLKGVRLIAQAYSIETDPDPELKRTARQAVDFVINHQKKDGSWGYSLHSTGDWTDNYHTGYVLDCLDEYQKLMNDFDYEDHLKRGYQFYRDNFINPNGSPKFYYNKSHPIDCTSAAQTILTSIRFGDKEVAQRVGVYMIENMQKPNGSFKFRKFKYYTIITSFMRWSDAWMFAALSNLKV